MMFRVGAAQSAPSAIFNSLTLEFLGSFRMILWSVDLDGLVDWNESEKQCTIRYGVLAEPNSSTAFA